MLTLMRSRDVDTLDVMLMLMRSCDVGTLDGRSFLAIDLMADRPFAIDTVRSVQLLTR